MVDTFYTEMVRTEMVSIKAVCPLARRRGRI